jgi:hypothetical protein
LEHEWKTQRSILIVDVLTPTTNQGAGSVQIMLALKVCGRIGYKSHCVPEDNWLVQDRYTADLQLSNAGQSLLEDRVTIGI